MVSNQCRVVDHSTPTPRSLQLCPLLWFFSSVILDTWLFPYFTEWVTLLANYASIYLLSISQHFWDAYLGDTFQLYEAALWLLSFLSLWWPSFPWTFPYLLPITVSNPSRCIKILFYTSPNPPNVIVLNNLTAVIYMTISLFWHPPPTLPSCHRYVQARKEY